MTKKIYFCQDCGCEIIDHHDCDPDFMMDVGEPTHPGLIDLTGEPDPVFDAIKEYERLRPTLQ